MLGLWKPQSGLGSKSLRPSQQGKHAYTRWKNQYQLALGIGPLVFSALAKNTNQWTSSKNISHSFCINVEGGRGVLTLNLSLTPSMQLEEKKVYRIVYFNGRLTNHKLKGEARNGLCGVMTKDVDSPNNFAIFRVLITNWKDIDECQETVSVRLFTDHIGISHCSTIVDDYGWRCMLMWHDFTRRISENMRATVLFTSLQRWCTTPCFDSCFVTINKQTIFLENINTDRHIIQDSLISKQSMWNKMAILDLTSKF